jgi:hypothetical protein
MPAIDVYKGDHWSVVRSIASSAELGNVNIWIASAGYGLISPVSEIVPYAATLSARQDDSIAQNSAERRAWWTGLTEKPPTVSPKTPRSLREVAKRYSDCPMIIAASSEYIDAMAADIIAAKKNLSEPELLTVLCRQGGAPEELRKFSITLRAEYSTALGGALSSLNARVLRWIVGQGDKKLTTPAVSRLLVKLAMRSQVREIPTRKRLTDTEVRAHMLAALSETKKQSRTALLKAFRDRGLAVEQRRFGNIYKEVMREAEFG